MRVLWNARVPVPLPPGHVGTQIVPRFAETDVDLGEEMDLEWLDDFE